MGENIFDSKSLDYLSLFKKIKSEEKEKEEITNLWMCYEDKMKKDAGGGEKRRSRSKAGSKRINGGKGDAVVMVGRLILHPGLSVPVTLLLSSSIRIGIPLVPSPRIGRVCGSTKGRNEKKKEEKNNNNNNK